MSRAANQVERAVLIPAYGGGQGRDRLVRGLDEDGVRAAVAGEGHVKREREEQFAPLDAAYREPKVAKARLNEPVARDGTTSAARRIESEPSSLGEFQGRMRPLAGAEARAERASEGTAWRERFTGSATDRPGPRPHPTKVC